jgi:hypothetical protein
LGSTKPPVGRCSSNSGGGSSFFAGAATSVEQPDSAAHNAYAAAWADSLTTGDVVARNAPELTKKRGISQPDLRLFQVVDMTRCSRLTLFVSARGEEHMRVEAFTPQGSWKKAQQAAVQAERAGFDSFPMVVANTCWDLQRESRGRFALGLGTQIQPHNERRFSVKWSSPRERLREYVLSLRAIWRAWEKREKLKFEGEHYKFTLMTPEFPPEPTRLPPIPIYTAAVGPLMLTLAGEICDAVRLHGFANRKYLQEVALPALTTGLTRSGRARTNFEICGGGFICTGPNDETVQATFEAVHYRVGCADSTEPGLRRDLLTDLKSIASVCEGVQTSWS